VGHLRIYFSTTFFDSYKISNRICDVWFGWLICSHLTAARKERKKEKKKPSFLAVVILICIRESKNRAGTRAKMDVFFFLLPSNQAIDRMERKKNRN
jgi:hypothetical protein